jgi:hypothetical protein
VATKRPDPLANESHDPLSGPRDPALQRATSVVSHRAVATLEEAKDYIWDLMHTNAAKRSLSVVRMRWAALPESGGTVTLPDGTVIEVKPTAIETLATAMRWSSQEIIDHTDDQILAAFNAQASGPGQEKDDMSQPATEHAVVIVRRDESDPTKWVVIEDSGDSLTTIGGPFDTRSYARQVAEGARIMARRLAAKRATSTDSGQA